MATHLDLAIRIADLVREAQAGRSLIDVERHARRLFGDDAPPPLTLDMVAAVLRSECADLGLTLPRAEYGHA